jgi:hypothetical protein
MDVRYSVGYTRLVAVDITVEVDIYSGTITVTTCLLQRQSRRYAAAPEVHKNHESFTLI